MNRARIVVAVAVALMCVAGGALAAGGSGVTNAPSEAPSRGIGPLRAKHATAAAFVDQGVLVSAKGITRVTSPGVGQFCLKLKDKTINPFRLVPQVTVEWGSSSGYDILANWYRAASDCPEHHIEVQTFDESSPGWVFSNDVSFNVVVP